MLISPCRPLIYYTGTYGGRRSSKMCQKAYKGWGIWIYQGLHCHAHIRLWYYMILWYYAILSPSLINDYFLRSWSASNWKTMFNLFSPNVPLMQIEQVWLIKISFSITQLFNVIPIFLILAFCKFSLYLVFTIYEN